MPVSLSLFLPLIYHPASLWWCTHKAMMPSLGQGGCQAVEDAYVLTNILKDVKRRRELPAALESYYKQRIIRTTVVQCLSRFSSDLIRYFYSTPASIQFYPFRIKVPNGLSSIVTSICKPIFPALLYFQFRYVRHFLCYVVIESLALLLQPQLAYKLTLRSSLFVFFLVRYLYSFCPMSITSAEQELLYITERRRERETLRETPRETPRETLRETLKHI